jgi:hypothetical protein
LRRGESPDLPGEEREEKEGGMVDKGGVHQQRKRERESISSLPYGILVVIF